MFVTIQLKNPSQQDRLSQARQMDARAQCPPLCGGQVGGAGPQKPEGRWAPRQGELGHFLPSIPHVWRTRTS